MVDNRSAGFFGIGGAFNFKSGDISGTAANNDNGSRYVDQSAVLRASLNSLAMMNVANIINSNKRKSTPEEQEEKIERDLNEMMRVQKVSNPFKENRK